MSDEPYSMSINFSLKIDDYDGTPVTSSEPIIIQHELRLIEDVFTKITFGENNIRLNGVSSQSFLREVIPVTDKIIYEGNHPFDVSISLLGQNGAPYVGPVTFTGVTHSSGSFTGGGIENTYTFNNLIEGATYQLKMDITNTIQFSETIQTNNIQLNESAPTINNIVTTFSITNDGILKIYADADFKDLSSDFDAYMAVFDTPPSDLHAFYMNGGGLKLTPTPHSGGNTLSIPGQLFTEFYKAPYTSTTQISSIDSTYNVNFYCVDTSTNTLSTSKNSIITINYGILVSNITLSNLTNVNSVWAKVGDSIQLSWKTLLQVPSDTLNVVIMGQTVTPVTTDNVNWTATHIVPSTHEQNTAIAISITHVQSGNVFTNPSNTITVDKEAPVFTYEVDQSSINGISIAFYNLQFSTTEIFTTTPGYTITFDLSVDNVVEVTKTFDLDSTTDETTKFVIDGLTPGASYTISARVTDLALNVSDNIQPSFSTFVSADSQTPVFINTEVDQVVVRNDIDSVFLENIKVYDTFNDVTLYAALFDGVFNSNDNYVEFVDIIQNTLTTSSNSSVQSVYLTDRTAAEAFSNPQSFTFDHYIKEDLTTTDIQTEKTYNIFYYAIDHETVSGFDSNISFNWKQVTVGVPNHPNEIIPSTNLITNLNSTRLITSSDGYEYIRNNNYIGFVKNATLNGDDVVMDNSSYILFNDEFYDSPIVNETVFTLILTITPNTFPSGTNVSTLIYQSDFHYVKLNSEGQLFIQWGTDILSPIIVYPGLKLNEKNNVFFVVNSIGSTITISVNEFVSTSIPKFTISLSTNPLMYGNNSQHNEGFVGVLHTPLEWVNRELTQEEQYKYISSQNKLFEYHFDDMKIHDDGRNMFVNKINVDQPLFIEGDAISLNTSYPRIGSSAITVNNKTSYLQTNDISSVSLNGNHCTVMFWYYHPNSLVLENDLITLSGANNEKLLLGISRYNDEIVMSVEMTNSTNIKKTIHSSTTELTNNTWHHLAFVLKETTLYFYHNGFFKGLTVENNNYVKYTSTFNLLKIGGEKDTNIDHLIIYNKPLSRKIVNSCFSEVLDSQMLLRYNFEVFTDNTAPNPDKIFDESIHTNDGEFFNTDVNVSIKTNVPISKNAVELDGISEYIQVTSNSNLDGSKLKQSTFSAWVNINNSNNNIGFQPIVYKQNVMRFGIDNGVPSMQYGDGTRFFTTTSSDLQMTNLSFSYTDREHSSSYATPVLDLLFDSDVNDSSTSLVTYNGTLSSSNIISYNEGVVPNIDETHKAIVFKENNDFVDLGSSILSETTDEMTISTWIKVNSVNISGTNTIASRNKSFTFGMRNGELYLSWYKLNTTTDVQEDGTTVVNTIDNDGNVVSSTTIYQPDIVTGNVTQITVNEDSSTVETVTDSSNNILSTTTVSSPDEVTGYVTTTVTQADSSSISIVVNTSGEAVSTTTVSAPDSETGNVTTSITSSDGSISETIVNASGETLLTSTTSSPDAVTGVITTTTIYADGSSVVSVKDSSNIVLQTTSVSTNESTGNVTTTVTQSDSSSTETVVNPFGDTVSTTTITAPDEITGYVTTTVTQSNDSSVSTVTDIDGNVINTTETSSPDVSGNITTIVTQSDGSSVSTVTDTSGNVLSTMTTSTVNTETGFITYYLVNADGSSVETIKDQEGNVIQTTTVSAPDGSGNTITTIENSTVTTTEDVTTIDYNNEWVVSAPFFIDGVYHYTATKNEADGTVIEKLYIEEGSVLIKTTTTYPIDENGDILTTVENNTVSSITDETIVNHGGGWVISSVFQINEVDHYTATFTGTDGTIIERLHLASDDTIISTTTTSPPDENGNTTTTIENYISTVTEDVTTIDNQL